MSLLQYYYDHYYHFDDRHYRQSLCHYHNFRHNGHRPLTKGQWCRVFLQVRRSLAYFWNKNTFNWNQLLPWWSTVVNATFRIPSTMGACPKMPVTMPNRGGVFGFGFGFGLELRTGLRTRLRTHMNQDGFYQYVIFILIGQSKKVPCCSFLSNMKLTLKTFKGQKCLKLRVKLSKF